jgi:hypothetical protein
MIELLLPCGFDTLEYSWVNATIGIYTLADYSMAKKRQQLPIKQSALLLPCFVGHASMVDQTRPGLCAPRSSALGSTFLQI